MSRDIVEQGTNCRGQFNQSDLPDWLKNDAILTKIYKNRKLIRTYTKLVSYKEQKKSTCFLALTI
jgi:hypothetical protein